MKVSVDIQTDIYLLLKMPLGVTTKQSGNEKYCLIQTCKFIGTIGLDASSSNRITGLIQARRASTFCLEPESCCCYQWSCPKFINVCQQIQCYLLTVTKINLVWPLGFSFGKLVPNDAAVVRNLECNFICTVGWERMHIHNMNGRHSTFWLKLDLLTISGKMLHALNNGISKVLLAVALHS